MVDMANTEQKIVDKTFLASFNLVTFNWMQDENSFASKGAHVNLKCAECAIHKFPGMS
jgi:hypothetical protein